MLRSHGGVDRPADVDDARDRGLADAIEHLLVWLDGLRDRRGLSTGLTAMFAAVLAFSWGLTQWRSVEPVDDSIPGIEQLTDSSTPGDRSDPASDPAGSSGTEPEQPVDEDVDRTGPDDVAEPLVVHVSGAVRSEGLVEVPAGSRLADAIAAAGGGVTEADIHRLNLATPLIDGMHIRVPLIGDEHPGGRPLIELASPNASSVTTGNDRVPGTTNAAGAVNVNTANPTELEQLPGVGPATAAAIIARRDQHGPFRSMDDLLNVPGIGPAKLAAMEAQVIL